MSLALARASRFRQILRLPLVAQDDKTVPLVCSIGFFDLLREPSVSLTPMRLRGGDLKKVFYSVRRSARIVMLSTVFIPNSR